MFMALTLSTNLISTERSKLDAGNATRLEQPFTSRTMQHIKAAHQLTSSPGPQTARQTGAVQGKTPLTSSSARSRLRDTGSETRKLDVGLRVSAVKVAQRQPVELSQSANGDSPYSSTQADGKGTMKRKGVVKSASFSAGSSESTGAAQLREDRLGRSSSRGIRPNTAPAASENYQPISADSTKQPPKRRQLTEAPELPFAFPSFRPSTCSTAHFSLLHSRQVQRPGTPNLKADAVAANASTGIMASNYVANVRVPTSASTLSRHADASKQDCALAKLAAGSVPGARALHPVSSARSSQWLDLHQQSKEPSLSCSSSDSSSIAAALEDAAHKAQAVKDQHSSVVHWEAVRVQSRVYRQQSCHTLLDKASINESCKVADTSQHIGLGGQGVSSGALFNALKSLGSARQTQDCQKAPVMSCQRPQNAANHMTGNTVTSCVSLNQDIAAESTGTAAAVGAIVGPRLLDPLVGECAEIMHLFGMDDDWFEHEFLPYAHTAMLHAPLY